MFLFNAIKNLLYFLFLFLTNTRKKGYLKKLTITLKTMKKKLLRKLNTLFF